MNHSPQNTKYTRRCPLYAPRYRTAFTLIEILIVVAILGILAAVTLPSIQGHITKAKEATAKDNLRTLRQAIERYANDHDGIPPGYPNDDVTKNPDGFALFQQLSQNGIYLSDRPENPFNGLNNVIVLRNDDDFLDNVTGEFGWIYKPQTKETRIDWPGKDSEGVEYFDY